MTDIRVDAWNYNPHEGKVFKWGRWRKIQRMILDQSQTPARTVWVTVITPKHRR